MADTLTFEEVIQNIANKNIQDADIRSIIDDVYQEGLTDEEKSEILFLLKQKRSDLYGAWMLEVASIYI